jgi:GT2 family glycosyltransferase
MGVVSNFAGLQSVPRDGPMIPGFTPALMGKLLDLLGSQQGQEVRFVHGFCYAIHRSVVDKIGVLDVKEFPHYGSEDDYTFRAYEAGFRMAVAENVFVYHAQNKSYGEHRKEIIKESVPRFYERHGSSEAMQVLAKDSHMALGALRHKVFKFLENFQVKEVPCKAN